VQNIRKNLRFIWADKIVFWLAILLVAMSVICWVLVAAAAGVAGANHVIASLSGDPITTLVSLWAVLRAIDFIAKGSTYRLFHAESELPAATTLRTPTADVGKPMAAH
jgi:hypothetical protein